MPLPREPQRRTDEQRRKHLDAHEVILERALLARADALDDPDTASDFPPPQRLWLAAEFRALATELHYW